MTVSVQGSIPEWTLGDRLRKAREQTGLGQKEFAERLGVSRNTVGNSENGTVDVRRITLNAWAMATGVSVEWLETGQIAGPPTPPDGGGSRTTELERLTEQKRTRRRRGGSSSPSRRYVAVAA